MKNELDALVDRMESLTVDKFPEQAMEDFAGMVQDLHAKGYLLCDDTLLPRYKELQLAQFKMYRRMGLEPVPCVQMFDEPALHAQCSYAYSVRIWAGQVRPKTENPPRINSGESSNQVVLGVMSGCFLHAHPTGNLIYSLLMNLSKVHFKIILISTYGDKHTDFTEEFETLGFQVEFVPRALADNKLAQKITDLDSTH